MQNDEPLPGYSIKIPFRDNEEKLLNFRSRRSNTDELRKGIINRWELQELSYHKKLSKMKKQNLENRIRLEKSLKEQSVEVFEPPKATHQTISYGNSNERSSQIPIQVSGGNHRRVLLEIAKKTELLTTQGSSRKKVRRLSHQQQILYGIKQTQEENIQNSSQFKDKQSSGKMQKSKNDEKRLEYQWVRRVRIAKGNTKLYHNETDQDQSCSSSSEKNHKPQETLQKGSQQQKRSHFRYPLTQRQRNPSNSYAKNSFGLDEDSSIDRLSRYHRKNRGISTQHNQFKSVQNSNEQKGKNGHLFPKTHSRYKDNL